MGYEGSDQKVVACLAFSSSLWDNLFANWGSYIISNRAGSILKVILKKMVEKTGHSYWNWMLLHASEQKKLNWYAIFNIV